MTTGSRRSKPLRDHDHDQDQIARSFDRDLVNVGLECAVLKRSMTQGDLGVVERAAYALTSAWLTAEASAMRIFAVSPGVPASKRFARKALIATSSVVTALFGEVLAETSKWIGLDPQRPGIRGLRAVLCQLSLRVDAREIDVYVKHSGAGLPEWQSSHRRAFTRHGR